MNAGIAVLALVVVAVLWMAVRRRRLHVLQGTLRSSTLGEASYVLDGLDAMEFTLPGDRLIRVPPLDVSTTLYFYRLMSKADRGDPRALEKALREFPEAIGLPKERLYLGEWMGLMRHFFSFTRAMLATPHDPKKPIAEKVA